MDTAFVYEFLVTPAHALVNYGLFWAFERLHFFQLAWLLSFYLFIHAAGRDYWAEETDTIRLSTRLTIRVLTNAFLVVLAGMGVSFLCQIKNLSKARYSKTCLHPPVGLFIFWFFVHLSVFAMLRILLAAYRLIVTLLAHAILPKE